MEEAKKIGKSLMYWLKDVKKTCPTCRGRLRVTCDCDLETRNRKCSTCFGTGTVKVKKEVKEKKEISKCTTCNGKKIQYCECCKGAGFIRNSDNIKVICIECMGESIVKCTTCNGEGAIYDEVTKIVEEKEICKSCNGEGKTVCRLCDSNHTKICPTCNGKGTTYKYLKIGFILFVIFIIFNIFVAIF